MGTGWEKATRCVNALRFYITINAQTLTIWNVDFRKNSKFPHPNPNVSNGLKPNSSLFEYFPTAESDAKAFILEHMKILLLS